jgi:hypothetical protein
VYSQMGLFYVRTYSKGANMATYPIQLSSTPATLKKRKLPHTTCREYATRIEDYLNRNSQKHFVSKFDYFQIASDLGIEKEIIKAYLAPKGGGLNGITITNPKANEL